MQGLFAATACVEINQRGRRVDGAGRLKFDFTHRPPHRFFRGNEGHPRPRCFNIHEVKPHPSLWETMTGLWRGKGKKSLINAAIYLETHE